MKKKFPQILKDSKFALNSSKEAKKTSESVSKIAQSVRKNVDQLKQDTEDHVTLIIGRLDKQKEKQNDLSIKNSRLWQKEQVRLKHDKIMQERKKEDDRRNLDIMNLLWSIICLIPGTWLRWWWGGEGQESLPQTHSNTGGPLGG